MRLSVLKPSASPAPPVEAAGPRSMASVRMLRVSLTDRCNFRCTYCMPADGVAWLPRDELLTFEEIHRVAEAATAVWGVDHLKLTGGEPTLRSGLTDLVRDLPAVERSMTTNGFRLHELAGPLAEAGLARVTVSLDSLDPAKFRAITRTGDLETVLAGVRRALDVGLGVKLNVVAMRGVNDDEAADFAGLTRELPVTVRFIEYMPLGDAQTLDAGNPFEARERGDGSTYYAAVSDEERGPSAGCSSGRAGVGGFVGEDEVRRAIERAHGTLEPVERDHEPGVGPATVWRLPGAAGRVGFISAMSRPFCATCNRLRLTATGVLRACLFDGGEVDLRPMLRAGATADDLAGAMQRCVAQRPSVHSVRGNQQMSRIGG